MGHWTLDDIAWDRFDPGKVDPDLLLIAKCASMVERNGDDYAAYLCRIFHDDSEFQAEARTWAREEVQHGEALGRWASLADPDFGFEASFRLFREGYQLPLDADASIRGSRTGELVARCIVETGTSSFYSALAQASDEPVFREICQKIAADELRHYRMFYKAMKRYLDRENIGRVRRFLIALGRVFETEDDELAYAHHAACAGAAAYDHRRSSDAYLSRAYAVYRRHHLERAMRMIFKAVGLDPQSRLSGFAATLMYRFMRVRHRQMRRRVARIETVAA